MPVMAVRCKYCLCRWNAAKGAERDENTQRDDFSPSEMVVHARRIEHLERDLAKQRQQQAGREHGRGQIGGADSAQAITEPAHERKAHARTAKAVGTSHDTLSKARHVIDTAEDPATPPEVAEVARQAAANLEQPSAVVDREHPGTPGPELAQLAGPGLNPAEPAGTPRNRRQLAVSARNRVQVPRASLS